MIREERELLLELARLNGGWLSLLSKARFLPRERLAFRLNAVEPD